MLKFSLTLLLSLSLASSLWALESEGAPVHLSIPTAKVTSTASSSSSFATVLYLPAAGQDGAEAALALKDLGIACAVCPAGQSPVDATNWLKSHLPAKGGDPGRIFWLCERPVDLDGSKIAAGVLWIANDAFAKEPRISNAQRFQLLVASDSLPLQATQAWKQLDHGKLGADAPVTELSSLAAGDLARNNSPLQFAVRKTLTRWNPPAPLGMKGVKFVASPNWSMRPAGEVVDTIVVHATVINTMDGTIRAFMDDKIRKVSAHYCIDRDGTIIQMVDENLVAHHAGVSELEGKPGVNGFSIGFELINLNDGVDPYPEAQYQALAKVIRDIRTRWNVLDSRIVSHEHIARPVGRKSDPVGFDFAKLIRLINH
jgi:N-acetylmuramoyl-L-alanine amidase